jgi:hypothetical protein
VDESYFATFGIRLLEGRSFNSGDREGSLEVILVNRNVAERFWPSQDALGKAVLVGDVAGHPARQAIVIGVTANGKYSDFAEPDQPVIYTSFSQHYQPGFAVVARTKGDPRLWIEPVARVVREAGLTSAFHPLTYKSWSNFPLLLQRLTAGVAGVLNALGLMLALVGLAGAITYSVSERKRELGIRVALGATPHQLMRLILRQTAVVSAAGIAIGIVSGTVTTALLRSKFFGIGLVEWTVLISVSAAMLVLSLAVAYFSGRAWIVFNPMEAVRHA